MNTDRRGFCSSVVESGGVLISTLYPLGGNYGGLMQAYALQRVIREMGFEARTINSKRGFSGLRFGARRLRFIARRLLKHGKTPLPLSPDQERNLFALPRDFVNKYIETVDIKTMSRRELKILLNATKAIVVGSDQVWRGGYANLRDQLLEYTKGFRLTRISYAASFGGDHLIRYSPRLVKETARLVKKFDAVSVREESGIRICREKWGVEAVQHVDPTFLLNRSNYEEIISSDPALEDLEPGGLFSYILDENPRSGDIVQRVADQLQLEVFSILPDQALSSKEIKQEPENFRMKSVPQWLWSFANADFVVTDSFHGTVFSIIFNKPFLAIGNKRRGMSRFSSILSLVNLESRLIDPDASDLSFDLSSPNWLHIEKIIAIERERSLHYLGAKLSGK